MRYTRVLIISALILWTWYAYVIDLCCYVVESKSEATFMILLYHIFFISLVWSFYKTIFTPVSIVPAQFEISPQGFDHLQFLGANLPIMTCLNDTVRTCRQCQIIKPDRAHHCSACNRCILKMDHHCYWVNNCINYSNYKFFILLLGYGLLYCVYGSISLLMYLSVFLKVGLGLSNAKRYQFISLFILAIIFALVFIKTLAEHFDLILRNQTFLETLRAPEFTIDGLGKNGFDIGRRKNFEQVFGVRRRYWFLPVFTSLGDGVKFPVRHRNELELESIYKV